MKRKWVVALLVVLAVLVVVAVGGATAFYFLVYKPLFSGMAYVGGAQRLESILTNRSSYDPPASGELTGEQVARFMTVEQQVAERVGARLERFRAQREALAQGSPAPTKAEVRRAMAEIGGVYLQAKETQFRAFNDVGFSKAEYEWVREHVYTAAGLPFVQLELQDLLVDPAESTRALHVKRPARGVFVAERNRQMVAGHIQQLTTWLPLAFFDL